MKISLVDIKYYNTKLLWIQKCNHGGKQLRIKHKTESPGAYKYFRSLTKERLLLLFTLYWD